MSELIAKKMLTKTKLDLIEAESFVFFVATEVEVTLVLAVVFEDATTTSVVLDAVDEIVEVCVVVVDWLLVEASVSNRVVVIGADVVVVVVVSLLV
jgi:hypothetical protein